MSDFAAFVAAALRDKAMSELVQETERLRNHVQSTSLLRISGPGGEPVYAETQLEDGTINNADPTFWYVSLDETKQILPCPLETISEVEISIGGVRIGGFGGNVTGVHLDPYNVTCKVWNLYIDPVAAVTVGICGWPQQQWTEFLGNADPREFVRGLQDIKAEPEGKTATFMGVSLPLPHIRQSPCMTDILLKNQKLLDQVHECGLIRITGRYGHPVYAQAQLIDGAYHSGDSNIWFVSLEESKQLRTCHLASLSGLEVYVGGIRIGRFDQEVYADGLEPYNDSCKVWDLHPVGLCVATIGIYGWQEQQWVDFLRNNHQWESLVELPSVLAEPEGKTVAFLGVSLPVKHIKSFPCMPEILKQNDKVLQQIHAKRSIQIAGRHGQPIYARAQLKDGTLQSGYSERWHVDLDDLHSCPLSSLSGIEISVAGNHIASFDGAVFAHLVSTSNDLQSVWELSCDGLAGATIAIHGWSEDQWINHLGSADPRELGILDLPCISAMPTGKTVTFLAIKLRLDDRLKKLLVDMND